MEKKKVKYVCEGTCKAEVSQEEHDQGKLVCQTKGCSHFGQHFKRVEMSDREKEVKKRTTS